jgi:L-iditol 2-dehydrogenase
VLRAPRHLPSFDTLGGRRYILSPSTTARSPARAAEGSSRPADSACTRSDDVFRQDALIWTGDRLFVASHELPRPRRSEVLLQLDAVGLCSSDFQSWCGRKASRPGVPGHEGAGTIVAVGDDVRRWSPGDFVIVNPLLSCGACAACARAQDHVCPQREIVGYNGRGLMATAQLLDERCLVAAPSVFPRPLGWLVEPLACVIHGQRRLDGAGPEDSLLVLGCGPMGVLHATWARRRGVRRVWLCDRDEAKLDLARTRGVDADEWIPFAELASRIDRLTDGRGAEVTVTANSMRDGHEAAFQLTRAGGRVLAFASILDRPGPIALPAGRVDSDDIHRREDRVTVAAVRGPVTVVGSIGFDGDSFREAVRVVPEIEGARFVTAVRRLDEIPALAAGEWTRHLKIVVYPSDGNGRGHAES